MPKFSCTCIFIFVVFLNLHGTYAQGINNILKSYADYTEAPRELVYVHLNKSTYLSEEHLGFTAYVLDKQTKKPSLLTTNLYVSIEDENNKVIKNALLKVENGVASNVFDIDSTLTSGKYTFKAYTNWMRNFKEFNHFVEYFEVIDKNKEFIEYNRVDNTIDAQFLPESGHLLHNVRNNIGVIIKDTNGYGVSNVKGKVFDKDNKLITEFTTNQLGIGKFLLMAQADNTYTAKINHFNKDFTFRIQSKVEPIGTILSLSHHRNKTIVAITTNNESLHRVKNKPYKLALHNGKQIDIIDLKFDNETTIIKVFDKNRLPSGVNIFTLFNEYNQPIAERMFFNYNGIEILNSKSIITRLSSDSLKINLKYKSNATHKFNNLSVSVLPQETQSYSHHHNLISTTFLKPYLKGAVEQAKYYFTDTNDTKKRDLDNLLITQGWSSYDWNNIFNNKPKLSYDFEQGITLKANVNKTKDEEVNYAMQTHNSNKTRYFSIDHKDNRGFYVDNLFPNESERIYFSKMEKNEFKPTKFYVQSSPQRIPVLANNNIPFLGPKTQYEISENLQLNLDTLEKLNKVIELSEVKLVGGIEAKRLKIEKLSKYPVDRVMIIDEKTSNNYLYLSDLIRKNGGFKVEVNNSRGYVSILNRGLNATPPAIYIDDIEVNGSGRLYNYPSSNIDYISFKTSIYQIQNKNNLRTKKSGAIRVYTKEYSDFMPKGYKKQEFKFPLTFKAQKRFYKPKYRYYNDDFFKHYGVIDWKSNLRLNNNGEVSLTIQKPKVSISLFIEGITNDGVFISEEKTILLN
ncbi:MAG: Plug domain-containing protein [Winogradskyella sp.]